MILRYNVNKSIISIKVSSLKLFVIICVQLMKMSIGLQNIQSYKK